jgi:hypothetical protein
VRLDIISLSISTSDLLGSAKPEAFFLLFSNSSELGRVGVVTLFLETAIGPYLAQFGPDQHVRHSLLSEAGRVGDWLMSFW